MDTPPPVRFRMHPLRPLQESLWTCAPHPFLLYRELSSIVSIYRWSGVYGCLVLQLTLGPVFSCQGDLVTFALQFQVLSKLFQEKTFLVPKKRKEKREEKRRGMKRNKITHFKSKQYQKDPKEHCIQQTRTFWWPLAQMTSS